MALWRLHTERRGKHRHQVGWADVRRWIGVISLAVFIAVAACGGVAVAGRRVDRCTHQYDWTNRAQRDDLVACIGRRWHVPGAGHKMVRVGRCESGHDLQDLDGSDGYIGTFQHITSEWLERWRHYGRRADVPSSPTNVLSQSVVTAGMVNNGGWGPWPVCGA